MLTNTSGFVYYVSITGITGSAAPDRGQGRRRRSSASSATPRCRSRSASASRTPASARAIAAGADGVVVGSALVDALRRSLDKDGKATAGTVKAVTDLVADLAQGVRSARRVAAE